jgi:hypothetical protein
MLQDFIDGLSQGPFLGLMLFQIAIVWPLSRILRRAGFSPMWALFSLVPLGHVVPIGVMAHSRWPVLPARQARKVKARRTA